MSKQSESLDKIDRMVHAAGAGIRGGFSNTQWEVVINWMQDTHQGYFDSQTSPDGAPWQELHPITIARKGHAVKLIETSELVESLVNPGAPSAIRLQEPQKLTFGTSREWAGVHQKGHANIPARPFAGLDEQRVDEVTEIIADALEELLDDLIPD